MLLISYLKGARRLRLGLPLRRERWEDGTDLKMRTTANSFAERPRSLHLENIEEPQATGYGTVLRIGWAAPPDGRMGIPIHDIGTRARIGGYGSRTNRPCSGIGHQAIARRTICYSNDVLTDDRLSKNRTGAVCQEYRTVASAPLIVDGEAFGVLCFDWPLPESVSEKV